METKTKMTKEEYNEMMRNRKEQLYGLVDLGMNKAVSNPKSYLKYLEVQGNLGYSVTNSLLVSVQKPDAMLVKDAKHWNALGSFIKKGEKGIQIFEAKDEYTNKQGKKVMNYMPKTVFDVSQVQIDEEKLPLKPSLRDIISSTLRDSGIKYESISDFQGDIKVVYSPDHKCVYYADNLSPEALISGLIRENCYIHYEAMKGVYNREETNFMIESAAYVIACKYDIPYNNLEFSNTVTETYNGKTPKQIKADLNEIRGISQEVSKQMEKNMRNEELRKHKKQEYER